MTELFWGTLEVLGVMVFSCMVLFMGYCIYRVWKDLR